jgi:hypothetical protein
MKQEQKIFNHEMWTLCPEHGYYDLREHGECPDCKFSKPIKANKMKNMQKTIVVLVLMLVAAACGKQAMRRDYVCTTTHLTNNRGTVRVDTMRNKTQAEIDGYCTSGYIKNDSIFNEIICE